MEIGPPPSVNVTSMVLTSYNSEKQKSYHKQYKYIYIIIQYIQYIFNACLCGVKVRFVLSRVYI